MAETHIACPCGKSSDAYCVYDDGWGHCFSCDKNFKEGHEAPASSKRKKGMTALIPTGEFRALAKRRLRESTCRKFGYFVAEYKGKTVQVAPYHDAAGRVVAQKVRFADKSFMVTGDLSEAGLFGMNLARRGGKRIAITEGEIDAMSLAQTLNLTWPVVSVPNGASGAKKALQTHLDFLESYENVVLCFDNDDPGQEATAECAQLFTPGKCLIMKLPRKDANEMLQAGETKQLVSAFWEAQEYRPDGIVDGRDTWGMVEKEVEFGHPYPWKGLNDILYGRRGGEVVTWCAGTGTGKSAIVAEIAYHALMNDDRPIGYIALEEPVSRSARRFVGLHLNKPLHLPGHRVDAKALRKAWEETCGTGKIKFYDHFGSIVSDELLGKMRYLVKGCGCGTLVLDHISIVISGLETDNERKDLDVAMTNIRSFSQETGVNIHLVSHLKRVQGTAAEDGGQISLSHLRGSQAIAQLSDAVLAAERDQQAEDEEERNTTKLRVLKNRYSGETGLACALKYDRQTGRLTEVSINEGQNAHSIPGPDASDDDDGVPF